MLVGVDVDVEVSTADVPSVGEGVLEGVNEGVGVVSNVAVAVTVPSVGVTVNVGVGAVAVAQRIATCVAVGSTLPGSTYMKASPK